MLHCTIKGYASYELLMINYFIVYFCLTHLNKCFGSVKELRKVSNQIIGCLELLTTIQGN